MLKLNISVALTILGGAIAVAAGVTYVVTKIAITVSCPAPAFTNAEPSESSPLPPGAPVQPYHGKQF
jgi:hypothetical protein